MVREALPDHPSRWSAVCSVAEKIGCTALYEWKSKYSGMGLSDVRRLKGLEDENAKLKKLLAEQMLDNAVLEDLLGKI
jgi:putative transposase